MGQDGVWLPQGTVLSPILFLAIINDLPEAVSSRVRVFADDCVMYRPVSGHLAERHLADRLLADRHLADRTLGRQTFGRQDI